jgi:hypothetical protein
VTAALAYRVPFRAAATAMAVTLGAAVMMLGAGTAGAQPRQVVCTIGGDLLMAPVTLSEGEQVQLVVIVPMLDTRITIGAPQAPMAGTDALSSAVDKALADVLGVAEGTICWVAVEVQSAAGSVVPPPSMALPTLPRVLPSQSVQVPVPGIDVFIEQGVETGAPPGGAPAPNPPPMRSPGGSPPGYRFDLGRVPLYDFSVPYGVNTRFGPAVAPAFRFGQRVPGYAPQFGILGSQDVRSNVAGKVQALPAGGATAVGLPVLLAVLMLSTVSGALARTWTLRRAA